MKNVYIYDVLGRQLGGNLEWGSTIVDKDIVFITIVLSPICVME